MLFIIQPRIIKLKEIRYGFHIIMYGMLAFVGVGGSQDGITYQFHSVDCIANGNLWINEESYTDTDGDGAYTDGEVFEDGPTFIFKDVFQNYQSRNGNEGTGVIYNEKK